MPGQSEIICIHTGDTVNSEVRKCFRLLSAKHDGTDCEEKLISVVFAEDNALTAARFEFLKIQMI